MTAEADRPVISVMLAVPDAAAAAQWYARALGATELWNLGGVVGLTVTGAPFFLGEPENNGWDTPQALGSRTVRVELFVDDPDSFIERAVTAGADGSVDQIRDHQAPWGRAPAGWLHRPVRPPVAGRRPVSADDPRIAVTPMARAPALRTATGTSRRGSASGQVRDRGSATYLGTPGHAASRTSGL